MTPAPRGPLGTGYPLEARLAISHAAHSLALLWEEEGVSVCFLLSPHEKDTKTIVSSELRPRWER